MQENSLHNALKRQFAGENGQQEVLVEGYFVDVVLSEQLIEVQTRSFSSIKAKLANLLQNHQVTLVHPIPVVKWIVQLPTLGETPLYRRKSPRRGRVEHLFQELIRFPEFVNHPNFSILLVMTHEEEIRRLDGRGSWRRKGASIVDRTLLEIVATHHFANREDFLKMLPDCLPQPFTNQQLAVASGLKLRLARKMSYCLRKMQAIKVVGKQGRELLYTAPQPAYNRFEKSHNGEQYG